MSYTANKIVIGGPGRLIRFSFAQVLKPAHNDDNDRDEYSVMLLIPKTDKESIRRINNEIQKCKEEWYGKNVPRNLHTPLQDGDEYFSSVTGEPDKNRLGCYYMTAKTQFPPDVKKLVAGKKIDAQTEDDFYSGCWGIASVNFYNYDNKGKKGISAGLSSLMKIKDGERLGGGRADADKEFAEFDMSDFDADQDDYNDIDIDTDDLPF